MIDHEEEFVKISLSDLRQRQDFNPVVKILTTPQGASTNDVKEKNNPRPVRLLICKPTIIKRRNYVKKINDFISTLELDTILFPTSIPLEDRKSIYEEINVAKRSLNNLVTKLYKCSEHQQFTEKQLDIARYRHDTLNNKLKNCDNIHTIKDSFFAMEKLTPTKKSTEHIMSVDQLKTLGTSYTKLGSKKVISEAEVIDISDPDTTKNIENEIIDISDSDITENIKQMKIDQYFSIPNRFGPKMNGFKESELRIKAILRSMRPFPTKRNTIYANVTDHSIAKLMDTDILSNPRNLDVDLNKINPIVSEYFGTNNTNDLPQNKGSIISIATSCENELLDVTTVDIEIEPFNIQDYDHVNFKYV